MSAAAERLICEEVTPFDIARFLAIMEHPEVKAAIFKLIDEREREHAKQGAIECQKMM